MAVTTKTDPNKPNKDAENEAKNILKIDKGSDRECVKVVIRCRPFSETEIKEKKNSEVVKMIKDRGEIFVQDPNPSAEDIRRHDDVRKFTFDDVYPMETMQDEIFMGTSYSICQSILKGYNGSIIAYGQSGTGKTFTMEGKIPHEEYPDLMGISPRCFQYLFNEMVSISSPNPTDNPSSDNIPNYTFIATGSCIEIYNDEVFNLLEKDKPKLIIKEHPEKGFFLSKLDGKVLEGTKLQEWHECYNLMKTASKKRHTGQTLLNDQSSRSHCLFMMVISTSEEREGKTLFRNGKLNLVDLAGSERIGKTGAKDDRMKEGIKINLALSSLGGCISALIDPSIQYIPYRNSKLTRLLMDSLGGNTKTVMIANIGPSAYNYEETVQTLKFAQRAKQVSNKPTVNEDPKDSLIRQMAEKIALLKQQLMDLENNPSPENMTMAPEEDITEEIEPQIIYTEKVIFEEKHIMGVSQQILEKVDKEQKAKSELIKSMEDNKVQTVDQDIKIKAKKLESSKDYIHKVQEQKKQLQEQLAEMENTIVQTNIIKNEKEEQEHKLMVMKGEMILKEQEQKRLEREIQKKENQSLKTIEDYENIEEKINHVSSKLEHLSESYRHLNREADETSLNYQNEREEMISYMKELNSQISLTKMALQHFVPIERYEHIISHCKYNENNDSWVIERPTLNSLSSLPPPQSIYQKNSSDTPNTTPISLFTQYYQQKEPSNPRFSSSNLINPLLDMPDNSNLMESAEATE